MTRSTSSADDDDKHAEELQEFILQLSQHIEKEPVASEIEVLQSIYGDNAIRLFQPSESNLDTETIRYKVTLSFPPAHEDIAVTILVSLPLTYPSRSSPQLQLLSRYIGAFGVSTTLFASIIRTYISATGVEFVEDQVCVFDGLQNVLERCIAWYEEQLSLEKAGQLVREDLKEASGSSSGLPPRPEPVSRRGSGTKDDRDDLRGPLDLPPGIVLHVGDPIQDRKSTFIGRACEITHPSQVAQVIAHLLSDKKIARAAHPVINAWRCQVNNVLYQDNNDDGETAAGGRLAHLLQILEIDNVLVVVTRYFGGIHLGPDRFKHINQAARNALDIGGFLEGQEGNYKRHNGRVKKH